MPLIYPNLFPAPQKRQPQTGEYRDLTKRPRLSIYQDPNAPPPYHTPRYSHPWDLPHVFTQTNGPEVAPLFAGQVCPDYKTIREHTHDIVCDHRFFDRDMGDFFQRGDFLLMYTGPERVSFDPGQKTLALPTMRFQGPRQDVKKVVPLKFLQSIIQQKTKDEKNEAKWRTVAKDIMDFGDYINFVNGQYGVGSVELILSLIDSPEVFSSCFVPVGFMKSFNGTEVYHGTHFPLVTCQYSGKMDVSPMTSTKQVYSKQGITCSGSKLHYIVGMKSNGGNPAFNYAYPTLSYSADDSLVRQCKDLGFVNESKRDMETSCYVKQLGSFCLDYEFSSSAQARPPRIDLNMQYDYDKLYI